MTTWPEDTMAAKIKFYGDPRGKHGVDERWYANNVVKIVPPFKMYYAGKLVATISVHRKCADAFMAAFTEIWDKCGKDQKAVDKTGASDYAGVFNYRLIAGSGNLSNHSFACAIDLSPKTNGFNVKKDKTTLSNIVIDAFKRQGARWGGEYKGRTDPMHFEFVSPS